MKKTGNILIPLLLGFCIYLFLHKPNLILHHFLNTPNFYYKFNNNIFFDFIIYHFPDMLWSYSLSYFLFLYLPVKKGFTKFLIIVIIVSFSEIVQLFSQKIFTFDIIDLTLMLFTITLLYLKSFK